MFKPAYLAAMPARPTVLLTGFGPFPGIADNATALLVPRLAKAAGALFATHHIVGEILPTEWAAAPRRLTGLLERIEAVIVLHFGVSREAEGFQLELIGRNQRASLHDAAGELPASEWVVERGPALLASTLPAERIMARLVRLGLPCRTSGNAGNYLCNALLYHSLATARALPRPYLSGFVHVPASLAGHGRDGQAPHPECPLDWRTAVAGGLEIIAACLEAATEPPTPVKLG
jgi:pyroglutamyl-peptidase